MKFDISTEQVLTLAQQYLPQLLWALLILLAGKVLAKFLTQWTESLLLKAKVDETLAKFVKNISYFLLMALIIVAALDKLGVNTTSFAAMVAAAGLAIGLALKDSLSNFAAGVMLIMFRPFKAGDFVEVGGTSGIVEEVQVFMTQMRTGDNKRVIVPNGQILSSTITNYSANPTRRIDLIIGVSYGDDLKKVRQVLEDVLSKETRILPEPEPVIAVFELADSSINFAVRPWVNKDDYWPTKFALQEEIKIRFDQENISIPFPQRDVHLYQEPMV